MIRSIRLSLITWSSLLLCRSLVSAVNCPGNHYENMGQCVKCPDRHTSYAGSTNVGACLLCPSSMVIMGETAIGCRPDDSFDVNIGSSMGWRIWSTSRETVKGWAVDILEIKLYNTIDCSGAPIDTPGRFEASGSLNKNFGPEKAYQEKGKWFGKPDRFNNFFIGQMYEDVVEAMCMEVKFGDNYMKTIRVQAFMDDNWLNSMIVTGNKEKVVRIVWHPAPTTSPNPSPSPSLTPTVFLSSRPSSAPTEMECDVNHYQSGMTCIACPVNHVSLKGSHSIKDCLKCPDGMETNPGIPKCRAHEKSDSSIIKANGWRIWAPAEHTSDGHEVIVNDIKLYEKLDCSGPIVDNPETYVDSGHVGGVHGPMNAFQADVPNTWQGAPDKYNNFALGEQFKEEVIVKCIEVDFGEKFMKEVRVQAFINGEWVNVHIERGTRSGVTRMSWYVTSQPSALPTGSPSVTPTAKPSAKPSSENSIVPTSAPSPEPTSKSSVSPTSEPTMSTPIPTPSSVKPSSAPSRPTKITIEELSYQLRTRKPTNSRTQESSFSTAMKDVKHYFFPGAMEEKSEISASSSTIEAYAFTGSPTPAPTDKPVTVKRLRGFKDTFSLPKKLFKKKRKNGRNKNDDEEDDQSITRGRGRMNWN